MFFVWGSRLYGKVDEVPGMFFVATKFGHLWYLPLIPIGSEIVLREHEKGWDGIKIPLSGKSVLVAWVRAGLVLGAIWSTFGILISFGSGSLFGAIGSAFAAAAAAGLFILSKKLRFIARCSGSRARQIAEKAGLDPAVMEQLEAHLLALDAAQSVPR